MSLLCFRLQYLLLLAFCLSAGCVNASQSDTLYFMGDDDYPPFEFRNEHGEAVGFNVDLSRAIAEVTGLIINVRLVAWHEVYEALEAGTIDGAIGMIQTTERAEHFAFSDPHSFISHVMIVRSGSSITNFDQLAGHSVLVQEQDVMHQYAIINALSDQLVLVESPGGLFKLFNSGVGDAMLVSRIQMYYYLTSSQIEDYTAYTVPMAALPYCMAVQKNNSDLITRIDEGLHILHKTGRYDQIYNKWLGAEIQESLPGFLPGWWKTAALWLVVVLSITGMWSLMLGREVRRKTKALQHELAAKTLAEKNLQHSIERLHIAQKSANIGVWEMKIENRQLIWDQGMFDLYEQNPEALRVSLEAWLTLIHPDDKLQTQKAFDDSFRKKENLNCGFRIQTPGGKTKHIRAYATIVYDDHPNKARVIGVNWDRTDAAKNRIIIESLYSIAQAALFSEHLVAFIDKMREELGKILDTTNFFVALIDPKSGDLYLPYMKDNVEEFNYFPSRRSISRYVITQGTSMLLYEEDIQRLHDQGAIERTGGKAKVWLGVPLKTGNQTIGLIGLQSYTRSDAFKREHILLLEYITPQLSLWIQRKKMQDELRMREMMLQKTTAQLRQAQHIAKIGSLEWDVAKKSFTVSPEIYTIFGFDTQEALPDEERFAEKMHPGDYDLLCAKREEAIATNRPLDVDLKIFKNENDETATLLIKIWPETDKSGKVIKLTGLIQDITEQKNREMELKVAKELAEQSDKLKSAFLANMSHEIRTPMNSILGFAQLLQSAQNQEELNRYVQIINDNGEHLLTLIDQIIDLSKIEAGLAPVDFQTFDVTILIKQLVAKYQKDQRIKNGDIAIHASLPEEEVVNIHTDRQKLSIILDQLLDNAMKFTTHGSIHISCMKQNGTSHNFSIADTGRGISSEKMPVLFERPLQQSISEITECCGSGLGLALCRAHVELLGGTIRAESTPGVGSVFSFHIPTAMATSVGD
ncbi:MAG: transporter substrate-binding domain-containing protein [Bacteroidales bacterium]|jgi:signal transduction histidine kinase/ABC-type amino acid transport substrate-binding protein|nr:transporter substrate-binding domain-containing protein [Bacteroidales bacterium]MDD2632750.1 transporter substrate-binding domain-containing protein [Bacteroidales bacterium]MDD3527072.1 transporter substrate-binding domain-containing protein [Bacteroidales bacterium]MDD4175550.1 transporter substrate-binding domain-containing protein [Bacteroidales bacterium]MDD4741598.1 transporter substrate-binding domain-containing protein [Bacteroidales bacterium]